MHGVVNNPIQLTALYRRKECIESALQLFAMYQVKNLYELKSVMQKDLDEANEAINVMTDIPEKKLSDQATATDKFLEVLL